MPHHPDTVTGQFDRLSTNPTAAYSKANLPHTAGAAGLCYALPSGIADDPLSASGVQMKRGGIAALLTVGLGFAVIVPVLALADGGFDTPQPDRHAYDNASVLAFGRRRKPKWQLLSRGQF